MDLPWKVSWNTEFWDRLIRTIRAAEITVLNSAVRIIEKGISKWNEPSRPHICVGNHVGIWLAPVDWELLTILLCFGNFEGYTSILTVGACEHGAPYQLVNFVTAWTKRGPATTHRNPHRRYCYATQHLSGRTLSEKIPFFQRLHRQHAQIMCNTHCKRNLCADVAPNTGTTRLQLNPRKEINSKGYLTWLG